VRAAIFLAAVIATGVVLLPSSAASGRQKPYVLTALASIGTVYWRYDCVHFRTPEWSLGVRMFDTATTTVTYRLGRLTRRITLQPDEPTVWFRFRPERRRSLSFVQATEPGTLRASVRVTFGSHDCESYFPPRLSVQLFPR
jgi:hypothetical protein